MISLRLTDNERVKKHQLNRRRSLRKPFPEMELATELLTAIRWKPFAVFVLSQWVIGVIVNFCVPMGFFSLLFLTGGPYSLWSFQTLSTLLMSPIMTNVIGPLLLPLSLPSAAKRGWVVPLEITTDSFLFRPGFGVLRHILSGVLIGAVCAPLAFVAAYALSPMTAWTFVLAMATYIALLAAFSLPPSILIFCTKPNLLHMEALFDGQPLRTRIFRCIFC